MSISNQNSIPTQVLIVEDEVAIAMDLQELIEELGHEVVGVAYSYVQAVDLLQKYEPDVVMLDIALRGQGSGLDVARHIKHNHKMPFVFVTSFSDDDTLREAVEVQPAAYLVKPFKEKDIAPVIALAVAQKYNSGDPTVPTREYINERIPSPLSKQEYRVLQLLCDGCTNKALAEKLYVSTNTIKTHLYKLYQKMGTTSRSSTVSKAMKL